MASMDPEPPFQSGHEVVDHFVGINEMIENWLRATVCRQGYLGVPGVRVRAGLVRVV